MAWWSSPNGGKSRRKEKQTITKIDPVLRNPAFNALTPFQENLYWRICAVSPDRPMDASPSALRRLLYPLKRDLRESQVQSALTALTLAGCVAVTPDDIDGHPVLQRISAASLTPDESTERCGGTIGGTKQRQQQQYGSLSFRSPSNEENGATGENVPNSVLTPNEYQGDTTSGNAERLGITDGDITEMLERRNTIEFEARRSGLKTNERALMHAEQLAAAYSLEWLITAIQRAYDCPEWRYVDKILANAKERGTIADLSQEDRRALEGIKGYARSKGSKPVRTKKTTAELDEELKKWGVNLDG